MVYIGLKKNNFHKKKKDENILEHNIVRIVNINYPITSYSL